MIRAFSLLLRKPRAISTSRKGLARPRSHSNALAVTSSSKRPQRSILAKIDSVSTSVNMLTRALSSSAAVPNLRKDLASSEKKINREDLFDSISMFPGLTMREHCVRNGIPPHMAGKYLASLNALRLVKECPKS